MTHAVRIEKTVLREGGCPAERVVEVDVDDFGRVVERVQVVKLDYELRPGQTLRQVAVGYARLRNLQVIEP